LRAAMLRLVYEQDGQDLIEYGLLAGFISVTCAAAVALLGVSIEGLFWDDMTTSLENAANP
jgi:Flp pilus assembly pilin Flp